MKLIFLTACLIVMAQSAFAELCSEQSVYGPCTPDPGAETDKAKQDILDLIRDAKKMELDVETRKAQYLAARDNPNASAEQKFAACELYRAKKMAQDELYKDALTQTEDLYHVRPTRRILIIAKPNDPVLNYTKDLTVYWNPQVTDSGPGKGLVIKIAGSDNQDHYTGAMVDPTLETAKQAMTFEDGRVMILKDSFDIALNGDNPGFLANLLYHEARHFNQLDRPCSDDPDKRCGWARSEEDELSAYRASVKMAHVFGLTKKQRKGLQTSFDTYDMEVAHGRLTKLTDSPLRQHILEEAYKHSQINLEEEYEGLKKATEDARTEQLEKGRRDQEERERQERERAEQERLAREEENVRQSKRTAALYERQELLNEIARCWYRPIYRNQTDDTIIGFEDDAYRRHYYNYANGMPSVQDLKIMALIMRACDDVDRHIPPDKHKACNDAAPELSHPMRYDLVRNIEKATNYVSAECVNTIMANRAGINDSRSFEKVVAEFHKADNKKKAEKAKRERKEKERNQREENPGGGSRPPEGIKRYWDPSCECWVREY